MGFKVPLSKNYTDPIVFLPGVWDNRNPLEGVGYCPFEIDWGAMGGPNNSVSINLANNVQSPNSMSQIAAMTVDNSQCGSDVVFVYPDTSETITIPAFEPNTTVPVFTRAITFFVVAATAQAADITRFLVHNVMPPPIALPLSAEEATAVFNDITNDGTSTTQLIPLGVNGTIEAITAYITADNLAGAFTNMITIEDGTDATLFGGQIAGSTGKDVNAMFIDLGPISVRFTNGLVMEQSGTFTAEGKISVNVLYKTP